MPAQDTDRNLLFAVLALQADCLSPSRFVEACTVWASQKAVPIADLLVERGWLSADERQDVERKLRKHAGSARAGLAEVTSDHVRQSLAGVPDTDVQDSLPGPAPGHLLLSTTVPGTEERDRYTITRLHATGGIGRVWLARDGALGRDVALKELLPERAGHPGVGDRFLKEARVTGQLEHPGIVPIYELGQRTDNHQPFYTMRFVRGRTFRQAVVAYHQKRERNETGPLDLRGLLTAFVAVCNAVAYAHSRSVIHRDLKPANVILGEFGEVMVLDWGLARVMGEAPADADVRPSGRDGPDGQATLEGQVLGTPAYMAPEQADGRLADLDARTDTYGLWAILYELLTGRAPLASVAELAASEAERGPVVAARDFASGYGFEGNILVAFGDHDGAEVAYRRALEVRRKAAAAARGSSSVRAGLAISLEKSGGLQVKYRKDNGGLLLLREARGELEDVCRAEPWDTELHLHLVRLRTTLAQETSDDAEAAECLEANQKVVDRFARRDPDHNTWQREGLRLGYQRIVWKKKNSLRLAPAERDDLQRAERTMLEGLLAAIALRNAQGPENYQWLADLANIEPAGERLPRPGRDRAAERRQPPGQGPKLGPDVGEAVRTGPGSQSRERGRQGWAALCAVRPLPDRREGGRRGCRTGLREGVPRPPGCPFQPARHTVPGEQVLGEQARRGPRGRWRCPGEARQAGRGHRLLPPGHPARSEARPGPQLSGAGPARAGSVRRGPARRPRLVEGASPPRAPCAPTPSASCARRTWASGSRPSSGGTIGPETPSVST